MRPVLREPHGVEGVDGEPVLARIGAAGRRHLVFLDDAGARIELRYPRRAVAVEPDIAPGIADRIVRRGEEARQFVFGDDRLGGGAVRRRKQLIAHVLGIGPAHFREPFDDEVLLLRRDPVRPRLLQQQRSRVVGHLGDDEPPAALVEAIAQDLPVGVAAGAAGVAEGPFLLGGAVDVPHDFRAGELRRDVPVGRHELAARHRFEDDVVEPVGGRDGRAALVGTKLERAGDPQRVGAGGELGEFEPAGVVGVDRGGDVGVVAMELHHDAFERGRFGLGGRAAANRPSRRAGAAHETPGAAAQIAFVRQHGRRRRFHVLRIARRVLRVPAAFVAHEADEIGDVGVVQLVAERGHSRAAVPDPRRQRLVVDGFAGYQRT